jgi:quinol monooxygenase YgiN
MGEVVFALYKPHPGKDAAVRKVIAEHVPTLRRLEMVTDRPAFVVKSENGTYIEVFEWVSKEAVKTAHTHPEVAKVWEAMGQIADFAALDSLPESKKPFTHFEPVDL